MRLHKCEELNCCSLELVFDLPVFTEEKEPLPYCIGCKKRVKYIEKYDSFTGITKTGITYTYNKLHIYCENCNRELSSKTVTDINQKEISKTLLNITKEKLQKEKANEF